LPERVSADAALEQGGVERGGGLRGIDKAHCRRVLFNAVTGLSHPAACVEVAREGSVAGEGCRGRGRQRRWWRLCFVLVCS
jgi:hypothetical protein